MPAQPAASPTHSGRAFFSRAWLLIPILSIMLTGYAAAQADPAEALPDAFSQDQLLWSIELGSHQYTVPRVDGDRLMIGVNDLALEHPVLQSTGGGILMSLDRATGKPIWQLVIPRYMEGLIEPFHFNHWKCGVCSTPAIEGKRMYIVGPRGDVLCVDREGQTDGNDGPFLDDARYMGVPEGVEYQLAPTDGDILWRYDLIKQSDVVPHDVCGSCPLIVGEYLYACTSNGVDGKHNVVAHPQAPSLVVLDKHTGELAATDGGLIGDKTLHGQWSSPVYAEFDGQPTVLFGGGDGVLYAFEPLGDGATTGSEVALKLLWKHDCCAADYRVRDGQPVPYGRWNKKRTDGPSEIIGIPVVHNGRVYTTIGQSPVHGPGQGLLSCIDGATGQTVWESRQVDRCLSTCAIADGLLYISDYSGRLHCFDADTGEIYWQHDLEAGVWTSSPVVFAGRVAVCTEKNLLWILAAGKEKQVLASSRQRSVGITPVYHEGVLYLPTQRRLFAVKVE